MNPHFFFNSLNSLAMLVREARPEALTYRPAFVHVPLHHPERPEHADDPR
ncbi:MAG: histidine kinase [Alistipes shahii]